MTHQTRRDADFLPHQSPSDYLCLLEREREEARALLDEVQARAFDSQIRAQLEEADRPPTPPVWLILVPVILLTFIYAAEFARAGEHLAALAALLVGAAVGWLRTL